MSYSKVKNNHYVKHMLYIDFFSICGHDNLTINANRIFDLFCAMPINSITIYSNRVPHS